MPEAMTGVTGTGAMSRMNNPNKHRKHFIRVCLVFPSVLAGQSGSGSGRSAYISVTNSQNQRGLIATTAMPIKQPRETGPKPMTAKTAKTARHLICAGFIIKGSVDKVAASLAVLPMAYQSPGIQDEGVVTLMQQYRECRPWNHPGHGQMKRGENKNAHRNHGMGTATKHAKTARLDANANQMFPSTAFTFLGLLIPYKRNECSIYHCSRLAISQVSSWWSRLANASSKASSPAAIAIGGPNLME